MNFGSGSGVFQGRAVWDALSDKVQHVLVTYSSGTLLLYLDGALVGAPDVATSVPSSLYGGQAPVTLGSIDSGVSPYDKQNRLRENSTNTALTADEVLQNYNSQKSNWGL